MTPEELNEFFETEEGKKIFNEKFENYAEENKYLSQEKVQGLINNRDKLLKQEVELKKKLRSTTDVVKTFEEKKNMLDFLEENNILEIDDLETLVTQPKDKDKTNLEEIRRLKKLESQNTQLQNDLNDALQKAQVERQKGISFQRKAILTETLNKIKVKPSMFDATYALFNSRTDVIDNEDGSFSFILQGDELSSPIQEHIVEWSKTEDAKDFIEKPVNSGSSGQMQNKIGQATMRRSDFFKKAPLEQKEIMSKGEVKIID